MIIQSMAALAVASVSGLLAWRLARLRLASKAKAYDAKKHRAKVAQQLGGGHPPSWSEKNHRADGFFAGVDRLATGKGVPSHYAKSVLTKEVNVRRLLWYIGALEDQGATWIEQQMAVADLVVEWWRAEEKALKWA